MKEKSTLRKGRLYHSLQLLGTLPVLILGLICIYSVSKTFSAAMYQEVRNGLENAANMTLYTYNLLYPGDYRLVGEQAFDLLKGDTVLTGDYDIIDNIKEQTGMEITLFYYDTRILTTILNNDGNRIIGTGAEKRVLEQVLLGGKPHFYTNASIDGEKYFAYYAPVCNSNGSIVGMIFTGKSCHEVNTAVNKGLLPLILITIGCAVLVGALITSYTRNLLLDLNKIRVFMSHIAAGDLTTQIEPALLNRHDALSDMATSAVHMQSALHKLIEEDILTGLLNRRCGDQKLRRLHDTAEKTGAPFTIAIGDIDWFKKVNDTYGHDCGDIVLKQIAEILAKNMRGKGFVARWGGEEFLLVFPNTTLITSMGHVQQIMNDIRNIKIPYEEQTICVTMTFGLAQNWSDSTITDLLREADQKLYEGKSGGRNRIVS